MNLRQLIDRLERIEAKYGEGTWVYVRALDQPRAMVLLPATMRVYEWTEEISWLGAPPRIDIDKAIVYFEAEEHDMEGSR